MSFSFWISIWNSDFLYHQYLTRYDYNLLIIKSPKTSPNAMAHFEDILVMLLNVSYHKEHDYIWFRCGALNVFRDILKPFMK